MIVSFFSPASSLPLQLLSRDWCRLVQNHAWVDRRDYVPLRASDWFVRLFPRTRLCFALDLHRAYRIIADAVDTVADRPSLMCLHHVRQQMMHVVRELHHKGHRVPGIHLDVSMDSRLVLPDMAATALWEQIHEGQWYYTVTRMLQSTWTEPTLSMNRRTLLTFAAARFVFQVTTVMIQRRYWLETANPEPVQLPVPEPVPDPVPDPVPLPI